MDVLRSKESSSPDIGSLLPRHGASQVADGGTASNMEGSCEYIE